MKFKGIIFDLDGVLIHTDELHYKAWKAVADRLKIEFNRQINNRLRGVSRAESLDIILENSKDKLSDIEKQMIAEEKNEIYRKLLSSLSEKNVSSDVISLLDKLKNSGIKIAIGSSSKNARFILQQIKLIDYFDAISDGNNITRSKPDPEVFLKAAEYLCLPPSDCLVVEDAVAGIDAAKAGGFVSVGIGDAATYIAADHKLQSLNQIEEIIE